MSETRKLLKDTAIYGIPSILNRFLNFLLVPLHTAIFAAEAFGVITKFYAVTAFLNVVLTYGMETAYFRYVNQEGEKKTYATLFYSLFASSLAFLLAGILFRRELSEALLMPDQRFLVWMLMIGAFDALCVIPFAKLRQENRPIKFSAIRMMNILVNILLNVIFFLLLPKFNSLPTWLYDPHMGVGYVFIANLFASFLTLIWLLLGNIPSLQSFDKSLWKHAWNYAWPFLFIGLAGMVNEMMDRLLLDYLLPPEIAKRETGIYGACYKLSILIAIFIQGYRFAAEPYFFKRFSSGGAEKQYASLMNVFVAICGIGFLSVMLFLPLLADLFLRNKEFHEGLFIVPVLLVANIFLGIYFNLSVWYKLKDKTRLGSVISILGAILTIVLIFIFTPVYGYAAPAWTTLIVYFFMCVLCYSWGRKYYPVPYNLPLIGMYIGLPILIYWVYRLALESLFIDLIWEYPVKFLLILAYAFLVFTLEKRNKSIKSVNSPPLSN